MSFALRIRNQCNRHFISSPALLPPGTHDQLIAGSSRGRGNRAAGWFADYIKEQNNTEMESRILEEGINGWATGGDEYVRMMDEYDAAVWK